MSRELFIYWRVARADGARARAAAQAMQAALRLQNPLLVACLYQRVEDSGEAVTMMETYRLPGGIGPELQAWLQAAGNSTLGPLCQGERHLEVFEPLHGDSSRD